jgi:hypothetical protein
MTARKAYRATFEEYGRKLQALERLVNATAPNPIDAQIEAARAELERARRAHSYARDELAKELVAAGHSTTTAPKTAAANC